MSVAGGKLWLILFMTQPISYMTPFVDGNS
jgi:hypothetical protein